MSNELTIDELAYQTGMTARNIRAHQSRGLIPPPEVRGRTGYYGTDHIERIELIQELQDDGFNLELIGRLLSHAEGSSSEVLRFTRVLRRRFADEAPEITDPALLAAQWQSIDPSMRQRAVALGLLRPLDDGRYETASPRLFSAGVEVVSMGLPLGDVLKLAESMRSSLDQVADLFVRLFLDLIWTPFEEAGHPPERWPEVRAQFERLRPLAADAVLSTFQIAMDDALDGTMGRVLDTLEAESARADVEHWRGRSSAA